MLTHSCLQRSGVERNSTWERRKKKIQFLNKTKSSEVPVFFRQEIFRHKHFTCKCPRCEVCEIVSLKVCPAHQTLLAKKSSSVALSKQRDCQTFAQEQKMETSSSCDSFEGNKIRQWLWLQRQYVDMMVIFTEMVERWNLDYSFQNWSWPGRGKAGFLFNQTIVECCSRFSEYMIHHHWVISNKYLQFSSSNAISCKHSLTAK